MKDLVNVHFPDAEEIRGLAGLGLLLIRAGADLYFLLGTRRAPSRSQLQPSEVSAERMILTDASTVQENYYMSLDSNEISFSDFGSRLKILTDSADGTAPATVLLVTYCAGMSELPHVDPDGDVEIVTVLSGTLTVQVEAEPEVHLQAGETYTVKSNVTHRLSNGGPEPVSILFVILPGRRTVAWLREVAVAAPDLNAIIQISLKHGFRYPDLELPHKS